MKITTYPKDKILRKKCLPVKEIDDDLIKLLNHMVSKMRQADGVGLAAPQIGDTRRFFVAELEGEIFKIINPTIIKKSKAVEKMEEGCLSLPKANIEVTRPKKITAEYHDEEGDLYEIELEGFSARVFQHELDHLNGKLIIDYVNYSKF